MPDIPAKRICHLHLPHNAATYTLTSPPPFWSLLWSMGSFLQDYWIGFAVKESLAKIQSPGLIAARDLILIAVGITLVALVELWLVVRWLLNSIEAEWVAGKKAIEHEKKQFSGLVEAMYPSAVAERLLLGESQIVIEVPNATVFFSDIHNFTALSNSIDAFQLIEVRACCGVALHLPPHPHPHLPFSGFPLRCPSLPPLPF